MLLVKFNNLKDKSKQDKFTPVQIFTNKDNSIILLLKELDIDIVIKCNKIVII